MTNLVHYRENADDPVALCGKDTYCEPYWYGMTAFWLSFFITRQNKTERDYTKLDLCPECESEALRIKRNLIHNRNGRWYKYG